MIKPSGGHEINYLYRGDQAMQIYGKFEGIYGNFEEI